MGELPKFTIDQRQQHLQQRTLPNRSKIQSSILGVWFAVTVLNCLVTTAESCKFDCSKGLYCGPVPMVVSKYLDLNVGELYQTSMYNQTQDDDDSTDDDSSIPETKIQSVLKLDNRGITEIAANGLNCSSVVSGVADVSAIDLSYNNLTTIPDIREIHNAIRQCPNGIMTIDLNHNQISSIPAKYFEDCECMTVNLLMDSNIVDQVSNETFANFKGYELLLFLRSNRVSQISDRSFAYTNSNVEIGLILSNNLISAMPSFAFEGYTGPFLYVDLSNNTITVVPDAVFSGSNGVYVVLILDFNLITDLGSYMYNNTGLATSYFLHAHGNHITSIRSNTLSGIIPSTINRAFALYLGHNLIAELEPGFGSDITGADVVFECRLNNNRMTSIPNGTFDGFDDASAYISIDNNAITSISAGAFKGFNGNYFQLSMDSNNITSLPLGSLKVDFDLDLSLASNLITHLDNNFLADFSGNLASIDLSSNQITAVPVLGEARCTTLRLKLDSNLLTIVNTNDLGSTLSQVTGAFVCNISLRNNQLHGVDLMNLLSSYAPKVIVGITTQTSLYVDVAFNNITRIENDTFFEFGPDQEKLNQDPFLASDITVNISYNPIGYVSPNMFGTREVLEKRCPGWLGLMLDMSHTTVDECDFPDEIEFAQKIACVESGRHLTMDLEQSGVDSSVIGAYKFFKGVVLTLNLRFNKISSLDHSNMSLSGADNVDLSHNLLTSLPENLLPDATTIDLSYNQITEIGNNTFMGITLSTINLCCNAIAYVAPEAFGVLSSIVSVDLSSNLLRVVSASVVNTLPFTRLNIQSNKVLSLPESNNRIFVPVNGSQNVLDCDSYTPSLVNCTCTDPTYKYYIARCGYGICSKFEDGCPQPTVAAGCTMPNNVDDTIIKCISNCDDGLYRSFAKSDCTSMSEETTAVCIPLSNCSNFFQNDNGTTLPGYQTRSATPTTDRVCYPCSVCDSDDDVVEQPCTLYNNTLCKPKAGLMNRRKLTSGETVGIVMSVMLLGAMVLMLACWGQKQSRTLATRTVSLEMTERLLGEEEAIKLRQEQSYQIDARSVKLFKVLGRGAHGVVMSGEWLGSKVAVKQLDPDTKLLDTDSGAFEKEMKAMRALHHPNLVAFFGFGKTHKGQPFLVTELMNGTLRQKLHEEFDTLTWADNRRMLSDIVAGMLFLHTRDPPMIHRDLKSDNCLVGDNNIIKIADFGTVTRPGLAGSHDSTSDGQLSFKSLKMTASLGAGTPLWMAPEVMVGRHGLSKYGPAVDVYSFGMVMYEVSTGNLPFHDLNYGKFEFFDFVCDGGRPAIPQATDVPAVYKQLMWQCWHQDADSRPSFEEIRMKLSQVEFGGKRKLYSYAHTEDTDDLEPHPANGM
eukprot:m.259265 g.259265  ORF g.259265 m.259265 type:complete len:1369 (-) comp37820_c0_seq1:79-4185(-)